MESESQPTPAPVEASSSPRQLASGSGPVGRLKKHAKGLTDDVRAWLEMRFELAKIEFWERVNDQLDQVVLFAIVGGLGAVGGLVMLLATCFGLSWIISALTGWIIGALFLGFLLVAVLILTLATLIFTAKPRFNFLKNKTRATVAEKRVMESRSAGERRSE